jgi:hypothetical protein
MIYPDKVGRRIFVPPRRRIPPAPRDLGDAKIRYILEVAAKHPRFTPEEVRFIIRYGLRRHDITKAMVRYVLIRRPHPHDGEVGLVSEFDDKVMTKLIEVFEVFELSEEARDDLTELWVHDDHVIHLARFALLQHWLDRFRLRRPRVMCGADLEPDLGQPDPTQYCPRCVELAGWGAS